MALRNEKAYPDTLACLLPRMLTSRLAPPPTAEVDTMKYVGLSVITWPRPGPRAVARLPSSTEW